MIDLENWKKLVKIESPKNSPIQIGHSIVVDGHVHGKKNSVFSHFHTDHISDFDLVTSSSYEKILLHRITKDVMVGLKKPRKFMRNIKPLEYGEKHHTKFGETISLFDADHILGSSQVLVDVDSTKILYSGDFVFPSASTPKCDILILDPTHGVPQFTNNVDKDSELASLLFETRKKVVNEQKPVLIVAGKGTLQEIIKFLDAGSDEYFLDDEISFMIRKNDHLILNALYPELISTRNFIDFDSVEAYRMRVRKSPCIIFSSKSKEPELEHVYTVLEGRYSNFRNEPNISEHGRYLRLDLQTHSSYPSILDYVNKVEPEIVITDSSRSGYASSLAKSITDEFGKAAISRP